MNPPRPSINVKLFLFSLFFLVTGLAAGMFLGSILSETDKEYLLILLHDSFSGNNSGFISGLIAHLLVLGLISFSGFSIYGFPLALLLLFTRGFSTGFCDSLLLYDVAQFGYLSFFFSFLLPQLLLCIIYLTVTATSVSYAVSHLKNKNAPVTVR